ncbi:MAG: RagB/SusD family nutrient uptake outer membrane protein [Bacteroides sp.]|nr:RagB/SusD family nutrient uptake outer membrane protein [Bacteroides sp.]
MKKILYSLVAGAMVLFTGCSDFLEQDNRSDVPTDGFYNTAEGYESLTNAMYSSLRPIFTDQPNLFVGGTDLYGDGKSESVVWTYYTFTTSEGHLKNFYQRCYKGIQLANSVIAYGETTAASKVREQYIDEARFIRAWFYFQLVQQFGGVPLSNDMYTSAVMSHPRNTLKEVYDFIISEFEYLATSSKLLDRSSSGVGRANKRAANFFLAKAYLTRGWLNGQDYEAQEENIADGKDFENAAKYALLAINNEKPDESIETVFDIANEANDEFFWSVQYSSESVENPSGDGSRQMCQFGAYLGGSEWQYNKSMDGNYSPTLWFHHQFDKGDGRYEQTFMFEFHQNYFDFYGKKSTIKFYYAPWWATDADIEAWKADDPNGLKKDLQYVGKTIAEATEYPLSSAPETFKNRRHMDFGVPCIRKFDDYTEASKANRSSTCSMHDVSLARLGEAYLIAAEAYIKTNNAAKAAEMINTLRNRPGTIKPGFEAEMTVNASDMNIDFILKERACEMAGEYVRWTDLKRTHKLIEYFTEHNEDNVPAANLKGTDGKYKILRPIPQSAIDLNKAEIEQNPGY